MENLWKTLWISCGKGVDNMWIKIKEKVIHIFIHRFSTGFSTGFPQVFLSNFSLISGGHKSYPQKRASPTTTTIQYIYNPILINNRGPWEAQDEITR